MIKGKALMQIGAEKREVEPGDLIRIPPNIVHSIAPVGNGPVRAFAFAASFLPPVGLARKPKRRSCPANRGEPYSLGRELHR